MPTYEYECTSCSHTFEAFQSMKDEPLKECPQCGKKIRRLINGGSGIIFKGSGFYVTDKSKGSSAASINASKKAGGSAAGESKSSQSPAASSTAEKGGGESSPAASASKNAAPQTAKT